MLPTPIKYDELLHILDLIQAERSHRQIAIDLYGQAEVDAEWYEGSALRSKIRRRIKKALYLMNGGYRDLLIKGV